MGASKYQTRDQLLAAKSAGIVEEIDSAKQRLFQRGHDAEAINRPAVEALIGQELYPVTGFSEIEGLPLLASFDGITMDETIIFEHKLANQNLIASIKNGELEPHYYWQIEQQLLVSGAEKAIFVCGDETGIAATIEYFPVPGRKEQLIAGWHQFSKDLETFVPKAKAQKAIAQPVEALPAINYTIDLSNGISINSNLEVFKLAAQALVERSKELLVTDQDFENAKARVKQCESA
ncbi:MAG TPA: YqaJ viral recombinase family protein, partial [Cellvibrionaceae bacterium]|nr:YqaJ viral recombinase family protein [Cellvibrionaceae bacterium]